jgi:hypothetical protein
LTLFVAGFGLAVPDEGVLAAGFSKQRAFSSPEEAVKALVDAVKANNDFMLLEVFGSGSEELIQSGDPVVDDAVRARFLDLFGEGHKLVRETDAKVVLHVGKGEWPVPIPIVKDGGSWRFDTAAGKEEILNRRIGRNELSVIQVCLAYVDAQREYATRDRERAGVLEYAQRFASSPGEKDGLFWNVKAGEKPSPLGPLVVQAVREGYKPKDDVRQAREQTLIPYHGYYYKILRAQGKSAPGGGYDYVVKGKMIGGFGLVAWPARYGASGIMTFMVNHDGVVYEKDLGPRTTGIASGMTKFDPDESWKKVSQK